MKRVASMLVLLLVSGISIQDTEGVIVLKTLWLLKKLSIGEGIRNLALGPPPVDLPPVIAPEVAEGPAVTVPFPLVGFGIEETEPVETVVVLATPPTPITTPLPPSPSTIPFPPPSSRPVSDAIYNAVVSGDVAGCVQQLESSDDVDALADGLRFDPDRRGEFVRKTDDRESDPDVAIMKAFAQAALNTMEYRNEAVTRNIEALLRDRDLMQMIVNADPKIEFVPSSGHRRRLTCDGCSPVNSFVCSQCWASTVCSKFFWCPAE